MRYRNVWMTLALAMVIALPSALMADHHEKAKAEGGMDAAAMQEYMAKYAVPGPEHEFFAFLVGDWTAKSTMWMAPGEEPMKSEGKASYKMSLDGRYLMGTYDSEWMDKPFGGISIDGYDRVKKQYFNIWLDTAGTGYLVSHGQMEGDDLVVKGTMSGMADETIHYRMVTRITGKDSYVFTMHQQVEGQESEFKAVELEYTRAGAAAASD